MVLMEKDILKVDQLKCGEEGFNFREAVQFFNFVEFEDLRTVGYNVYNL